METLNQIAALRTQVTAWRNAGELIAFVPTMGNLHQGHMELIRCAKTQAQRLVVSIFVNPLQFGPLEDFAGYPRTLAADQTQLESANVDLLFAPTAEELYPHGQETHTRVEVPGLSNILCGTSRPGHFIGVATVVCKLLNIVQPDVAFFGEKDFQQLLIIRRMVADLSLPVAIVGIPTIREADGLAMSSRNSYLSQDERARAPVLYRALQTAVQGLRQGLAPLRVETRVYQDLRGAGLRPDYVKVRRATDLAEAGPNDRMLVVLAAAYLGKTRLIDNLQFPETPDLRAGH